MRWNDAYEIKSRKDCFNMMSTRHTGQLVGTGKIDFLSKEEIFKPNVIKNYNKTMGGVDTFLNPSKKRRIGKFVSFLLTFPSTTLSLYGRS